MVVTAWLAPRSTPPLSMAAQASCSRMFVAYT